MSEKTKAALALADAAADLWRGDAVNPWETRHARRQAFDAALDAYRDLRNQPDAPDLTSLEREYMEACYETERLSLEESETYGDCGAILEQFDAAHERMTNAFKALHAALKEPAP